LVKLLVVDDEVTIREYIKYVIKEHDIGVEIDDASNGIEAVGKVKEFRPDIILLDIRMPQMDGLEAARLIKQVIPWIKIVILTAYDEFTYAHEALRLGVTDYLLKPISPQDLIKTMKRILKEKNIYMGDSKGILMEDLNLESKLIENIKLNEKEEALKTLELLLAEKKVIEYEITEFKRYIVELSGIIVRAVISLGINTDRFKQFTESKQEQILTVRSIGEIKRYMKEFVSDILTMIDEHYLSPNEKIIIKAKNYIYKNYTGKIYLKEVADYVNLSPYYLSRIFKQQTGINFTEYLNKVRIKKAKEYIRNFDLSLGEISQKVGYEDFSYFSSVFRKYEGCLPSEFRKKHRTNNL